MLLNNWWRDLILQLGFSKLRMAIIITNTLTKGLKNIGFPFLNMWVNIALFLKAYFLKIVVFSIRIESTSPQSKQNV